MAMILRAIETQSLLSSTQCFAFSSVSGVFQDKNACCDLKIKLFCIKTRSEGMTLCKQLQTRFSLVHSMHHRTCPFNDVMYGFYAKPDARGWV